MIVLYQLTCLKLTKLKLDLLVCYCFKTTLLLIGNLDLTICYIPFLLCTMYYVLYFQFEKYIYVYVYAIVIVATQKF